MENDLRARSIATADEIEALLEYPLYSVDDEQATRIGKTFLSSGKISGIFLESTVNGILMVSTSAQNSKKLPEISRIISRDGLQLGRFTITFSDAEILRTQSSFSIITLFILLAVLLANIAANRLFIAPKVKKPFTAIFSALQEMAEGNYQTHIALTPYRDLNVLITLFNDMAQKIDRKNRDLQESEFRFKAFFDLAPFSCVVTDLQNRYRMANLAFCKNLQLREEEVIDHTAEEFGMTTAESNAEDIHRELLSQGEIFNRETVVTLPQGNRFVLYSSKLIQFAGEQFILSATVDITERKRAQEEKEKLQAQLLQSQKMESVGLLAGGVAHDFNNMLTIILGHSQLAMLKCGQTDRMYSDFKVIEETALRSAELVRQLLAFARKQAIKPQVIDLNSSIPNMFKMLHRLLGENLDLVWKPGEKLWPVRIDTSQLDQIVVNLSVNARDAIVGVGKVGIETGNILLDENYCKINAESLPGEYVLLAVSDDGCGMEKSVIDRIFEPFFTTKEMGQGTGMGLATVYGITRQIGGFINVYSEPGKGTTFKVYLPRFVGEAVDTTPLAITETPTGNGETLLVVEDDKTILSVAKTMLEKLGYTVIPAEKPSIALQKAKENLEHLQLLITDVVMPEMNGVELERAINTLKPGVKSLFMSGYTDASIAHHGVLDEGVHFLQKPFSLQDLASKVREALAG